MDLPLGLTSALESGNCVLFIGSGSGYNATGPDGQPAPTGSALAERIARRFAIDTGPAPELAAVSQVAEQRRGRSELISCVDRELADLQPDDHLKWLLSKTWRAIFTTNYDSLIERTYQLLPDATQIPVSMGINSEYRTWNPNFEVPIFHLHGSLASEHGRDAILITQQDYVTFREKRRMLFNQFKLDFATTPILYYGYSNQDPNWREIVREIQEEFAPSKPPTGYRIDPSTPPLEQELLQGQGIVTLEGNLADFHADVDARIGDLRVEPYQMAELASRVAPDLKPVFEEFPASIIRLLNSWEYVNQVDFAGAPNYQEFLNGNIANWSVVGQGLNFQRDLEEPLTQALVDYATDPAEHVQSQAHIILGPAGYGQTTLLRAIAVWFAKSRVGTALYLKPGAVPQEADIEFAVRHLPVQPVVFLVDNAADFVTELTNCFSVLRQADTTGLLLLADRLNEWRQRRPLLRPAEHALLPLSDTEIERLLESLERSNSLGALTKLDSDVRFSTVKIRNQQDLLVTMREITDGRAFDAIVEDEFLGIASDRGRELYGLASIFSRSRALLRADLCADVLGINIADLYQGLADETDGVVIWETIDEARGIEAIRTRHQIIANIVWARCLSDGLRERLILAIVDKLNLSFNADAKAFDRFTRDDDLIASLRGLEAKIRFFETAIRKDPTNAFIRQHFSRMLRRERRFDLALQQIDEALRMSSKARVLHHTRGLILGDLAIDAEVDEVARRRLAQGEQAFESAINMAPRDDYAYTGLADLYLAWARRSRTSTDESIIYISKAQEAVFRGLSTVRDRESLYLATSNIEKFLGDDEARIEALRKALFAAPQSPVSRYLLGAVLFRTGEPESALSVLLEGLTIHPDDPRITGLCGLVMYNLNKPLDEILAVLDLARTAAADDSFYNAILGGMLVLAGRIGDAEPIWARARQRQLTIAERERVAFEISEGGAPTWLDGRVATLGETYAFIRISGFPDVFCAPRRLPAETRKVDHLISLRVGFTVRGPVALEVKDQPSD